jgi:heme-degrading monooxygenase HmoA
MKSFGVYVRIFEFRVRRGQEKKFEEIYGPKGDWAQLFGKSSAFLRTELHRDMETRGRYVTIDTFTSQPAFTAFLEQFGKEYEALDRRCQELRASEENIGSFTNIES